MTKYIFISYTVFKLKKTYVSQVQPTGKSKSIKKIKIFLQNNKSTADPEQGKILIKNGSKRFSKKKKTDSIKSLTAQ